MTQIKYYDLAAAGWKYQLAELYQHVLPHEFDGFLFDCQYFGLKHCVLQIKTGYSWDGPSGPAIDTPDFMRGSMVHDVLYQLMRNQTLPETVFRVLADKELYRICREDGMSWMRAQYVYLGVRFGGEQYAKAKGAAGMIDAAPLKIAP